MVLGSSPVAVTSPSDFAPASSKEFLDIQATIECGFTLKRVRDMTRTYSHNIKHYLLNQNDAAMVNTFLFEMNVLKDKQNSLIIESTIKYIKTMEMFHSYESI